MSLNKNKMVREIGRRTRLKNREVQMVLETLIDVWTEELILGGKIELENFFVFETRLITINAGKLITQHGATTSLPNKKKIVTVRTSRKLRRALNEQDTGD